ncbi:hypothetical protein [Lysobacter gummosus]|uniref:hypothetical protein n=1 Tax=Lysobacter gummosus TaxID=262324 RepID=UPI003634DFF5
MQTDVAVQLDQAMPVVGHQHPAQQARAQPFLRIGDGLRGDLRAVLAGEDPSVADADGGDQVDPLGLGPSAAAQRFVAGFWDWQVHACRLCLRARAIYRS